MGDLIFRERTTAKRPVPFDAVIQKFKEEPKMEKVVVIEENSSVVKMIPNPEARGRKEVGPDA